MDDIYSELLPVFLDDALEKLDALGRLLERLSTADQASSDRVEFLRLVHSLKGTAGSFGFPGIGVICHRLEDYMQAVNHVSPRVIRDVTVFIDGVRGIVETGVDPGDKRSLDLFQSLPVPPQFDSLSARPLSALFIGPRDVQLRMMEAELHGCGIRLSRAQSSFQGIELAVRTRPDFLMVANVVDVLDGTEVVRMLRCVRRLRTVPVLVVTSEGGDPKVRERLRAALPEAVIVVRKYPHFPEDFADALTHLRIL